MQYIQVICIFSFAIVLEICNGQTLIPSRCKNLPVVKDFNVAEYIGNWYEIAKYPTIFEAGGKCNMANYDIIDENTVSVYNSMIYPVSQKYTGIKGTAKFTTNDGSAKLSVRFPTAPFDAPYWILGTDYKNYSIVWSCVNVIGDFSFQFLWFLTRERYPSNEIVEKGYRVIKSNRLDLNLLKQTDQNSCPIPKLTTAT